MEETFTYDNCVHAPLKYIDPTGESCYGPSEAERVQRAMNEARRQCWNEQYRYMEELELIYQSIKNNPSLWGQDRGGIGHGNTISSVGNSTRGMNGHGGVGGWGKPAGGFDLSRLSDSQRKAFCEVNEQICSLSDLYKTIYDAVNSCGVEVYVLIDNTIDVEGLFDKYESSIIFKNEESMGSFNVLSEEVFHAYQLVVNCDLYSSDPFNYEFEAKVAKYFIVDQCSCGSGTYEGNGFEPMYDYLFRNNITSPVGVAFACVYAKYAGYYAEFNNRNIYGDSNYKSGTMQSPHSLYKMFGIY